jgi:hypothetical protein
MKQLFNEITGRALDISFTDGTTDRNIYLWVKNRIEVQEQDFQDLELEEAYSCKVSFDADERSIQISGDEDSGFINIRNLELIELN